MKWLVMCCVACVALVAHGGNDLYTSVLDMRELFGHEQEMKVELRKYIELENIRLEKIRLFYDSLPETDSSAVEYIKGPVNSFSILERSRRDWDSKLADLVYEDNSHDLMAFVAEKRHKFANEVDLRGGLIGLKRLLDTYQLPMKEITNGSLSMDSRPMSAYDCFAIGREAYWQELWEIAAVWLEEALRLRETHGGEERGPHVTLYEILDYLSYSQFKMGRVYKAYLNTQLLLKIVPDQAESRVEGNLLYFKKILTPEELEGKVALEPEPEFKPIGMSLFWNSDDAKKYETLCRQPIKMLPRKERKLKCFYYSDRKVLSLIFNPAKIEVLHDKPRIYSIKQVLTDEQIDRLVELGKQKLHRATARNHISGQFEPADYRIAKSGWLTNRDDAVFPIINQRLEDITGFEMDTAEDLQLGVYGIGGHYEPHYDHARGDEIKSFRGYNRNRIATLLLYLSDVEQGGATVFPLAGARVLPAKGDAVFWYNLLASGESDNLTRHAGCPVLVGAKIVCNKWIHEAEQEFRYPCKLSRKARNMLQEPY